jgi:peptide/bleomycin uptake transporter
MIESFFKSKAWALWAYLGGLFIIVSVYSQVSLTVELNKWFGIFYDLLQKPEKSTIAEFYNLLAGTDISNPSFLLLALPFVFLAAITNWFTRIYALRWRESITFNYLKKWEKTTVNIEGASQRLQEDCNRFTRIVEDLGVQFLRALLTLIAFLPLLWDLSTHVVVDSIKDIEGSLCYVAALASLGGIIISWFVGFKLPGLEYNNQKVEAAFRKQLVYAEDDREQYYKEENIIELFAGVRLNYQKLYLHYGYFDIWRYLYEQFMVVVPYLIIGPSLFAGVIGLGLVVQVTNAFSKVQEGFAIFLNQWTTITELRSIWKRLHEFEKACINK